METYDRTQTPPTQIEQMTPTAQPGRATGSVPIGLLRPADSPRLAGEDDEHIDLLAVAGSRLPPILVHRASMRIIDGMHRWRAAVQRGDDTIEVEYFDGTMDEAFLRAVSANVEHGLPLTRPDREAAVVRIIASHSHMSDRAIATVTGLSAPTVGAIRRRVAGGAISGMRIGRDGRLRPINSADGRRRASQVVRDRPDASLREIARAAGVSVGTARDVREKMRRGVDPVTTGGALRSARPAAADSPGAVPTSVAMKQALGNLRKDPSLRLTERGRALLQWLGIHMVSEENQDEFVEAIPAHCANTVAELARASALLWNVLADKLERIDCMPT